MVVQRRSATVPASLLSVVLVGFFVFVYVFIRSYLSYEEYAAVRRELETSKKQLARLGPLQRSIDGMFEEILGESVASMNRRAIPIGAVLPLLGLDADTLFEEILRSPHIRPRTKVLRHGGGGLLEAADDLETAQRGWVVEVGSHDGVQARNAYEAGYPVMVFEPSPVNYKKLLFRFGLQDRATVMSAATDEPANATDAKAEGATYQMFKRPDLELYELGASRTRQQLTMLTKSRGGSGDHISVDGKIRTGEEKFYRDAQRRTVHLRRLADAVPAGRRIAVLKIDVQGHEPEVLKGAYPLFAAQRVGMAIIEFHPHPMGKTRALALVHSLYALGYDVYVTANHPFAGRDMCMSLDMLMQLWAQPRMRGSSGHTNRRYLSLVGNSKTLLSAFETPERPRDGTWTDIIAVCRWCVARNL